jgi:hypothetical protein
LDNDVTWSNEFRPWFMAIRVTGRCSRTDAIIRTELMADAERREQPAAGKSTGTQNRPLATLRM